MIEIGSLVDGKYKVLNKIGQGGMSIVYLAMNEKANKTWAIKEVRKDGIKDFEVVKQGLVVETDMLKKLSHPSLPSIIDVIEDENTFLIVMDYIPGNPLSKVLEEFGAQPQENVIEWAKQLCDVLDYLHTRTPAIIYRDMKPANVMLKPDGNVTLIDFGTAREFKEKKLADTTCLGTVGYAAPEAFGGKTDARSDIYCLGATLYHLVTGMNPCEPPYEIRPIREINPTLSGGLEKIILKCTQRNPEDRYQSCAELMYALENYKKDDDDYWKKQKRKLGVFIASTSLAAVCGLTSLWGYISAENEKSNNYDNILRHAAAPEDYYEAILTDPVRTEAYLLLKNMLVEDISLTKEEGQLLQQLQIGLDQKNEQGFSVSVNVLGELKNGNPDGYADVCYQFGDAFMFNYDVNTDYDRYANAAKWFSETIEKYEVAEIYCDIAECLELINQYAGAKVKQPEKMYEEYERLWVMIGELKVKADEFDSVDSKLQVWNEINNMINTRVTQFAEIAASEDLKALLTAISEEAGKVEESVIQDDITNLQAEINETIKKLETVRE